MSQKPEYRCLSFEPVLPAAKPSFIPLTPLSPRKLTGDLRIQLHLPFVMFLLADSFPSLPIPAYWNQVKPQCFSVALGVIPTCRQVWELLRSVL